MVIKNTFSGTVDSSKYSTGESINLPLTSATSQDSVSHYPVWSKVALNAIYKTFVDAGYTPIKNEAEYSISIWGFKFYVLVTNYGNGTISIYRNGDTGAYCSYYTDMRSSRSLQSNEYKFILTIRGNDDMFEMTFSSASNITTEYWMFAISKAVHIPTKSDVIYTMLSYSSSTVVFNAFEKSNLYNSLSCHKILSQTVNDISSFMNYIGMGKGYIKVPLFTTGFDCMIKGAILCLEITSDLTAFNQYYKIGNEIYYCGGRSNDMSYLIKVDTVTE